MADDRSEPEEELRLGARTDRHFRLPHGNWWWRIGALVRRGYLLFPGSETFGGSRATLDVQPGQTTAVTRAKVLAAGPTRWLLERCRHKQCTATVVNRKTGARRRLPTVVPPAESLGTISPDGRTAAFINPSTSPALVEVLALGTGTVRIVPIRPDFVDIPAMVWSPDSRWLFVLDRHGILYAVRRPIGDTLAMTALTPWLQLPTLRQLAIRR